MSDAVSIHFLLDCVIIAEGCRVGTEMEKT